MNKLQRPIIAGFLIAVLLMPLALQAWHFVSVHHHWHHFSGLQFTQTNRHCPYLELAYFVFIAPPILKIARPLQFQIQIINNDIISQCFQSILKNYNNRAPPKNKSTTEMNYI